MPMITDGKRDHIKYSLLPVLIGLELDSRDRIEALLERASTTRATSFYSGLDCHTDCRESLRCVWSGLH